ncbi:uncharacterized protein DUF922 [Pontibacter ummariensis]|uniref:DUF922 domain-containing protein n=1 Tax=Pontibacter ummariensis TaxID=1610492 RepID=A0A239L7H4_9BACT|nr:DUF922 domain-containing protein [Pontibacter ummariensis]PRY04277.1 uncharacterized protein DUF922 [Pontibacter ummariensis]SNT25629.1 protein of unknown function [Pontibacter ummariensis]
MYIFTLFLTLWARILLSALSPAAFALAPYANKVPAPVETDKLIVEKVNWSESRRLSWEDFKGLPDAGNPHHALTAANLAVSAKCKDNAFNYEVNCVFLPQESWSKNKRSNKLLEHEQLHFDLTEVHARLLRRQLQELNCENQRTKLGEAVNRAFDKWKAEQKAFDDASRHGLNTAEQQLWAANISQRLEALERYK